MCQLAGAKVRRIIGLSKFFDVKTSIKCIFVQRMAQIDSNNHIFETIFLLFYA